MRTTLFRQEALDFNREKLLGDALAASPLSLRFLTAAACALATCIVSFACWGEYAPTVHVSGYLAPNGGLIRVFATQTGTRIAQHVREGQHVLQGDTLFVLSTEEGSLQTPLAQAAAIATIEQRLESLHRDIARERLIEDMQAQGLRERMRDTRRRRALLHRFPTTYQRLSRQRARAGAAASGETQEDDPIEDASATVAVRAALRRRGTPLRSYDGDVEC
jgi:membrane fusion protein